MEVVPDPAARDLERAYRANYALLRRRSTRFLPIDEAEDAVQETFLRALARHEGRDPGVPWLLTVLRNLIIDRSRKHQALPVADIRVLDTATSDEPAETVVALDERRKVRKALAGLTPDQQQAMKLREWDGLSYQEIARRMGTTVPAVESLIQRGRRRLRTLLDGVCGGLLWPVAAMWRRIRGVSGSGVATAAAPAASGIAAAVAGVTVAAAVVAAGFGAFGGGGRSGGSDAAPGGAGTDGRGAVALAAAADREDHRSGTEERERDRIVLPGGAEISTDRASRDQYRDDGDTEVTVPIGPDEKGDEECDCAGAGTDAVEWAKQEVSHALGLG